MILTFVLIVIGVVISTAIWRAETRYNIRSARNKTHGEGIASIIVCTTVFCIIYFAVLTISYSTYLNERSFYTATKEQYYSAIDIYSDHAVIDMSKAAFTDLKYQGYQENIGRFINSLRNRIIKYNKTIVSKRVMGNNLFFSWFIVEPDDDMVIIKMKLNH